MQDLPDLQFKCEVEKSPEIPTSGTWPPVSETWDVDEDFNDNDMNISHDTEDNKDDNSDDENDTNDEYDYDDDNDDDTSITT